MINNLTVKFSILIAAINSLHNTIKKLKNEVYFGDRGVVRCLDIGMTTSIVQLILKARGLRVASIKIGYCFSFITFFL